MTRVEIYILKDALSTIESVENLINALSTENKVKITVTQQFDAVGEDFNIPKKLQEQILDQTKIFLKHLKEKYDIE